MTVKLAVFKGKFVYILQHVKEFFFVPLSMRNKLIFCHCEIDQNYDELKKDCGTPINTKACFFLIHPVFNSEAMILLANSIIHVYVGLRYPRRQMNKFD